DADEHNSPFAGCVCADGCHSFSSFLIRLVALEVVNEVLEFTKFIVGVIFEHQLPEILDGRRNPALPEPLSGVRAAIHRHNLLSLSYSLDSLRANLHKVAAPLN